MEEGEDGLNGSEREREKLIGGRLSFMIKIVFMFITAFVTKE